MKKLLLILLCLPMIGFGQNGLKECSIIDTVELTDMMDYMEGYDLTFKSLTTKKEVSRYIDYPKVLTKNTLQDFVVYFDHIGWNKSNIPFEDMKINEKYIITYYLKKYQKPFYNDIEWGKETVFGYHLLKIFHLKELKTK